jgi:hypothetical protein
VLATGTKALGSIPTEDDKILRVIKISSTTSLGGDVKPSVHVVRFFDRYNNATCMKEILRRQNLMFISRQVSPASLLDVSTCNC